MAADGAAPSDGVSAEAAVIYDRQLRVWGAEVQARLSGASVLVAGVSHTACEVAKNVVLAGVDSLTLVSDACVSDLGGPSFLIAADAAGGSPAAQAAASVLSAMNPMVRVAARVAPVASLAADGGANALAGVDLVIAADQPLAVVAALDAACAAAGVRFFAAGVQGPHSYMFVNLGTHAWVPKAAGGGGGGGGGGGAAAPDAASSAPPPPLRYVPFSAALHHPLSKLNRRSPKLFPVLKVCARFEATAGACARPASLCMPAPLPFALAPTAAAGRPASSGEESGGGRCPGAGEAGGGAGGGGVRRGRLFRRRRRRRPRRVPTAAGGVDGGGGRQLRARGGRPGRRGGKQRGESDLGRRPAGQELLFLLAGRWPGGGGGLQLSARRVCNSRVSTAKRTPWPGVHSC